MAAKKKAAKAAAAKPHGNRPRLELDRSTSRGELGARIREARDAAGIDLYDAGRLAGLSHSAFQKIETGANDVRVGTLLRVCLALGVDAGELMKGLPLERMSR